MEQRHNQTRDFTYITFSDLKSKAESPVTLPVTSEVLAIPNLLDRLKALKKHAPFVAPHDAVSKVKHDAVKNDHFTMLAIDIDKGNKSLNDIRSALKSDGIASFVIHSTGTSMPENKKWRVLIEISEPIDSEHWLTLQQYLCYLFEADSSVARKQQILFLPFKSDLTIHYEYFLGDGEPLDVGGEFAANAIAYREDQEQKIIDEAQKARPAKRKISLPGVGISPVDVFNQVNTLESLLKKYGFRKVGRKYLHPESESGKAGVVILDNRYYSHHSSDALSDSHTHDAFDLYVHFEHKGNYEAAIKAAGNELTASNGVSITQHNQQTFRAQQIANAPEIQQWTIVDNVEEQKPKQTGISGILEGTTLCEYPIQIADFMQFPRDTAVLTALGVISAPVSMKYSICYENGGITPLGVYVATEQPASSGKSTILKMLTRPIQKAISAINKKADEENKQKNEDEHKTPNYRAFVTDATPEGLDTLLPNHFGHFCLASSEQSLIDTVLGLAYNDKTRKANNGLILNGYSGDYHSVARVSRKHSFTGEVFGAVTVISQNGTIDTILENSNGTGIAERFFMLAEPTMLGYRDHARKPEKPDLFLETAYESAVEKLINEYAAQRDRDAPILENLTRLHIPAACWDRMREIKNQIEPMMADGEKYSHSVLRGVAGKFDLRVMKIAGVLHVFESMANGKTVRTTIKPEFVDMAIRLVLHSIEDVHRTMLVKGLIGRSAAHDAVLRVMSKGHNPQRGMTNQELYQHLKNVNPFKEYPKPAEKIKEALQQLTDNHSLFTTEQTRGMKKITAYFLT